MSNYYTQRTRTVLASIALITIFMFKSVGAISNFGFPGYSPGEPKISYLPS